MALSTKARRRLEVAMARRAEAEEIADAAGRTAAAVADEATANGSDLATTQALANALKVKVNALLASLRAAGLMDA